MLGVHRRILDDGLELKMLLQVHDELVFELPESLTESYHPVIEELMTTAMALDVPLAVDIGVGKNWLECK